MAKKEDGSTGRKICIFCEDSDLSEKIIDWAKVNLVNSQDSLLLVSVRHNDIVYRKPWPNYFIDFVNAFHQKGAERLEEGLKAFKDNFEGNQVDIKILRGSATGLKNYIDDLKPNVCLIGERANPGLILRLKRMVWGSTAKYLIKNLKVPIVICHC